jgi:hypothetical protein
MQFQPESYYANDDTSESPRKIYGFIAEDVNETMPELIILDSDEKPLTIVYVVMHALLLKLIQNQQTKIDTLQIQNNQANQNISDLTVLVQSLISRIATLENINQ